MGDFETLENFVERDGPNIREVPVPNRDFPTSASNAGPAGIWRRAKGAAFHPPP